MLNRPLQSELINLAMRLISTVLIILAFTVNSFSNTDNLTFKEIFDFQVGDIFMYKITTSDCGTGTSRCDESSYYVKYEIIQKSIKADTIIYERKINDSVTDFITYIDSTNHALNKHDGDSAITYFKLYGSSKQDTFYSRIDISGVISYKDTTIYKSLFGINLPNQQRFYQSYCKGLGLVQQNNAIFEVGQTINLIGYRKGNDTTGILTSTFSSSKPASNFLIYPNPFKDKLTITLPIAKDKTEISLMTSNGIIVKDCLINSTTFDLFTSELKSGIYILKINYNNEFIYKKIIKTK